MAWVSCPECRCSGRGSPLYRLVRRGVSPAGGRAWGGPSPGGHGSKVLPAPDSVTAIFGYTRDISRSKKPLVKKYRLVGYRLLRVYTVLPMLSFLLSFGSPHSSVFGPIIFILQGVL